MISRVQQFASRFKVEVSVAAVAALIWALVVVLDVSSVDFSRHELAQRIEWTLGFIAAAVAGGIYGFGIVFATRYIWARSKPVVFFILVPGAIFYVALALVIYKFRPGGF